MVLQEDINGYLHETRVLRLANSNVGVDDAWLSDNLRPRVFASFFIVESASDLQLTNL